MTAPRELHPDRHFEVEVFCWVLGHLSQDFWLAPGDTQPESPEEARALMRTKIAVLSSPA